MAQMTSLNLTAHDRSAARLIQRFKDRFPDAIVRALNRSVVSGRAVLASKVGREMGIKVGDAKDSFPITPATQKSFTARISASAKRVPLYKFGAKGAQPSRGKGRGVTVHGKRYPQAFIATMPNQKLGVFQRVGAVPAGASGPSASRRRSRGAWSPNLPIYQLMGPSVWHAAKRHVPEALQRANDSLIKNLRSEIRYALTHR